MNRFKKVIAVVLSALVAIAPFAAFANEITDYSVDGNDILSVEGKLAKAVKGAYVNFYMRKDGKLVLIKQGKTDKDGGYKFTIDMSQFENGGVFSIKITSQLKDENASTETIEYYTDEELEETYKDIFDKKNDVSYIADKISGAYKDKMVFTSEFFRNILNQENSTDIAGFIAKEINVDTSDKNVVDEIIRVLKITASIKMLEYSKDCVKIADNLASDETLESLGLKDNNVLSVFIKNIENDLLEADSVEAEKLEAERYVLLAETIIRINSHYTDYQDFISDIENAIVVADLSRCRGRDSLRVMLEDYSEKATVFDVSKLTDDALTEILAQLEKDEIASIEQIQNLIDKNKETDPGENNYSSSSSSGGGSGKPYSNGYVSIPTTNFEPTDIVKPEVTEFKDIKDFEWAKESVDKMVSLGMLDGYSKEEFAPGDNVTRSQFTKMMCNVFGISKSVSDGTFTDVASDAWYAGYVYALKNAGYINGMSETVFGPDEYITRQDVFTIVYRILKSKNFIEEDVTETEFDDWSSVADYAKAALATLSNMELIKGDNGNVKPKENMTRAEGAVVMHRIYEEVIQ